MKRGETIQELHWVGIIHPAHSAFNISVWPVKKPDDSWQITMDYWGLNKEVSTQLCSHVQNCHHLRYFAHDPGSWLCCIELTNFFFFFLSFKYTSEYTWVWPLSHRINMPPHEKGKKWVFRILPQSYLHRPTICHGMVAQDLFPFSFSTSVKWAQGWCIMFTCEDLPPLQNILQTYWTIFEEEDEQSSTENLRPKQALLQRF